MQVLFDILENRESDLETLLRIKKELDGNITINFCSKHAKRVDTHSYGQKPTKTVDTVAMTLAQYAMAKGKWLCARFLLENDRQALAVYPFEFNTPLHEVARCDNQDFLVWFWNDPQVAQILQKMTIGQINPLNEEEQTPLMLAIKTQKDLERITVWGRFQNDYDATDEQGRNIVHVAIEAKHAALVPMLLQRNPKLATMRTVAGAYPMHMAAMTNNIVAMEALVCAGACVDSTDKDFSRPLHWAAKWGNTNAMIFLLQHGTNVNATNLEKDSAFHVVIKNNHSYTSFQGEKKLQDALTLLLDFGADFYMKNSKNRDAWDLAAEHIENNEAKKLEFYWAVENHAQRTPSTNMVQSVINYLRTQGAEKFNQNTQNGFNACLDQLSPQPQQQQVSRYWSQPSTQPGSNNNLNMFRQGNV